MPETIDGLAKDVNNGFAGSAELELMEFCVVGVEPNVLFAKEKVLSPSVFGNVDAAVVVGNAVPKLKEKVLSASVFGNVGAAVVVDNAVPKLKENVFDVFSESVTCSLAFPNAIGL